MRSPRPESVPARAAPRKSLGPRPSSLATVDKSAPIDAQIAHFKNMFSRSSEYVSGGSQSPEAARTESARNGPLSEISLQEKRQSSVSSDVD